jgi:hypothetical protein
MDRLVTGLLTSMILPLRPRFKTSVALLDVSYMLKKDFEEFLKALNCIF